MSEILYKCDGKRCAICHPEVCDSTNNIAYAKNFVRNSAGDYVEMERDQKKQANKFIELYELAGNRISINIKRILYITTTNEGSKTMVKMNEGTILFVQESYDEILELIEGNNQ